MNSPLAIRPHRHLTSTLLLLLPLLGGAGEPGNAPPAPAATTRPGDTYALSEGESKHLDRQSEVAFAQIGAVLDAHPPVVGAVSPERALALSLMDAVLHDPAAPHRPAAGAFRAARTKRAVQEMLATKVEGDGAVIWQIYNMGFVVRTRSVTLGLDLVKLTHVPEFALDDKMMRAIVDQCDVLFVSHVHLDHADHDVANWFLDAGKPVLAPTTMWKGEPIYDRLTHLPRDGRPDGHSVSLGKGKPSLNVVAYAGFQNLKDETSVEDNVYVITTPDGLRVAHTGDNNVVAGLPPEVLRPPVDILIMKLMPDKLKAREIIEPFAPRLVVPSHFEEVGHLNVNAREPYWRGLERIAKFDRPAVIMTWGEKFTYAPAK